MPVRTPYLYRVFNYPAGVGERCLRQQTLRQWLKLQLLQFPNKDITGLVEDIKIPSPNDFIIDEEDMTSTMNHLSRKYPERSPNHYELQDLLLDEEITSIGMFVAIPYTHIFSVLLTKDKDYIKDITIMDTNLYPYWYIYDEKYEQSLITQIIIALSSDIWNTTNEQSFAYYKSITHFVHSNVPEPINLQEHEEQGFCQHWDTFFLYMTMVRGMTPKQVFRNVARMAPDERNEMMIDFINQVAQEAQVKLYTGDIAPSEPIEATTRLFQGRSPYFEFESLPVVLDSNEDDQE